MVGQLLDLIEAEGDGAQGARDADVVYPQQSQLKHPLKQLVAGESTLLQPTQTQ